MGDIKPALKALKCRHYKQQTESGPRVGRGAMLIVILWRRRMAPQFVCTYVAQEFIGCKSWKQARQRPPATLQTGRPTTFAAFHRQWDNHGPHIGFFSIVRARGRRATPRFFLPLGRFARTPPQMHHGQVESQRQDALMRTRDSDG